MVLWVVRWWLLRKAARIERAWPGPYPAGSYGAEMRRFAELVRELAEGL